MSKRMNNSGNWAVFTVNNSCGQGGGAENGCEVFNQVFFLTSAPRSDAEALFSNLRIGLTLPGVLVVTVPSLLQILPEERNDPSNLLYDRDKEEVLKMNYLKFIINVMVVLPMLVSPIYSPPQVPVQVPQPQLPRLQPPRPLPRQPQRLPRRRLQQLLLRPRQPQRLRPGLQKIFIVENID